MMETRSFSFYPSGTPWCSSLTLDLPPEREKFSNCSQNYVSGMKINQRCLFSPPFRSCLYHFRNLLTALWVIQNTHIGLERNDKNSSGMTKLRATLLNKARKVGFKNVIINSNMVQVPGGLCDGQPPRCTGRQLQTGSDKGVWAKHSIASSHPCTSIQEWNKYLEIKLRSPLSQNWLRLSLKRGRKVGRACWYLHRYRLLAL